MIFFLPLNSIISAYNFIKILLFVFLLYCV